MEERENQMNTFESDKQWSDQFIPQLKQIVGPLLLDVAPIDVDRNENTDLMVMTARAMRIACRVRRIEPNTKPEYMRQFTLRSHRTSGVKTEVEKVMEGFGDWMVYAWSQSGGWLDPWVVIDLTEFRRLRSDVRWLPACGEHYNSDGTGFYWYDWTRTPSLVIAASAKRTM